MTTTVTRRRTNPVTEVLSWLDGDGQFSLRADAGPFVRIEDYIEDDTYVLRAEIPGLDPEKDVSVDITADVLTIRGERREEEQDKHHHEIHYGQFIRTVRLPRGSRTDDVTATYADGLLEVRVPVTGDGQATRAVPIEHHVA